MIYEFTLVLDREPTDAEVETLAAAGLDPVGAEGPHPALVHLAIDAASLPAAIITAVRAIERLGIAVTGVQSADLVSLKDIAARTRRSYESVRKLAHGQRGPGGFPRPAIGRAVGAIFVAGVSAWLARHYPGRRRGGHQLRPRDRRRRPPDPRPPASCQPQRIVGRPGPDPP